MSSIFVSELIVLMLLAGCDITQRDDSLPANSVLKLKKGVPAIPKSALHQMRDSDDWAFRWRESIGQHALRTIEIDGKCGFVKQEFRIGKAAMAEDRTTGNIPSELCNDLHRLISSDDFGNLAAEYRTATQDGYAVRINLRIGAGSYEVYCSGYFPPTIREIAAIMRNLEKGN